MNRNQKFILRETEDLYKYVQKMVAYASSGYELECVDPNTDEIVDFRTAFDADMDLLMRELGILLNHAHNWDENSYCTICGADGRS